jgi:tripartite-type tricarboxylate transporter receptor subunit TctC
VIGTSRSATLAPAQRRCAIAGGLALVVLGGLFCIAHAQSGEPGWLGTKPIRFEVIAAPGGLIDIVPRTLSDHLAASIGVPVAVEDRPGAGGNVAAALVARAEPDGHTLLVTGSNQAVNPTLLPNPGFDYERDLAPVSMLVTSKLLLVASPSFPANTITDVIALAKQKPKSVSIANFADRHAQPPRRRNAGAVRRCRSQFRGL